MIKLSVNVNKIATLRNARGGEHPNVVAFAKAAIRAGADGITVHPRPDERHIREGDVYELKEKVIRGGIEFNIEGYPDARFLEIIRIARPHQATLVPDPPGVLTSNAGWNARENFEFLKEKVAQLKELGARVSLFMETEARQIEAAADTGADRIEFYTEPFAKAFDRGEGRRSFAEFEAAARVAQQAGLGINAGHDLTSQNLVVLKDLTGLLEVSIGHAIVCDALWHGWQPTIHRYLMALGRDVPSAGGDWEDPSA